MQWLLVAVIVVTCAIFALRALIATLRFGIGGGATPNGSGCTNCGGCGGSKPGRGVQVVELKSKVDR